MNKRLLTLSIALFCAQLLFAQTDDSTGMLVHTSRRLDELTKKQHVGVTAKSVSAAKNLNYKVRRQGYRVLVLNTNDREQAYKTKGQLLGRYPNQQLYMLYQAPFFKLKIGDFVSKKEAENLRNELAKTFTKGLFILRETVWVKPEEEAKL